MTTDYERGRAAGIEEAAKVFDDEAAAMDADGLTIAATIFERHAELVRALIQPASSGAGGEPWRQVDGVEDDAKCGACGLPRYEHAADGTGPEECYCFVLKSPTPAEPRGCPTAGADVAEQRVAGAVNCSEEKPCRTCAIDRALGW